MAGWVSFPSCVNGWVRASLKDMAAHGYSVTNKLFEGTVAIPRTAVEDDTAGIYRPMLEEMGRAAGSHPDERIFALLAAGFTTTCFDGRYFFDTDLPVYAEVDCTGAVFYRQQRGYSRNRRRPILVPARYLLCHQTVDLPGAAQARAGQQNRSDQERSRVRSRRIRSWRSRSE